jgi:hypothetical protein
VACGTEALYILERTNLVVEVGKTHCDLGVAYAHRGWAGDGGRACEHLLAARSSFRSVQAHGYLARVDAELAQILVCRLEGRTSRRPGRAL